MRATCEVRNHSDRDFAGRLKEDNNQSDLRKEIPNQTRSRVCKTFAHVSAYS